jgi:polysaccharide export outer membrane protein
MTHRLSVVLAGACLALAMALGVGASRASAADYRLQPGDVVEISVIGLPQLSQRMSVQLDGTIALPLIGAMTVEGATIEEVRQRVQTAFASRLLTLRMPDGQQVTRTVERDEVSFVVVQYRSIWVSGDVLRPGEQPYQPRISARQAIASAGGLRSVFDASGNNQVDVIGLENDYVAAWLDVASKAARAWRLRSELGESTAFDRASIPAPPVPEESLSRILSLERQMLRVRKLDHDREKTFLENAARLAREQIASLSQQLEIETQGAEDDQQEYERVQKLLSQGKLTTSPVVEARRAVLYSATRKLQTADDLMDARRRLAEFQRDLDKIDNRLRMSVLEELQKAEADLAAARVRLKGIEHRLLMAGVAVPGLKDRQVTAELTVIRRTPDGVVNLPVAYEDELSPGDVLQVVLSTDYGSMESPQAIAPETWRDARKD